MTKTKLSPKKVAKIKTLPKVKEPTDKEIIEILTDQLAKEKVKIRIPASLSPDDWNAIARHMNKIREQYVQAPPLELLPAPSETEPVPQDQELTSQVN